MPLPRILAKRNAKHVRVLFNAIRQNAPHTAGIWLDELERDALQVRPGWRSRFDAWLQGFEQAKGVSPLFADQWRRDANVCLSTAVTGDAVVFCVLWTMLVTLSTLAWQSKLTSQALAITGCIVVAATAGIWSYRAGWLSDPGRPRPRPWQKMLRLVGVMGAGVVVGVLTPGLLGDLAKVGAYRAFVHQQEAFATAPNGYPWLRDFARREMGLDVVLQGPADSWPRTTLQTFGTSPAFMDTGNGLCELSMSRVSLLNSFATVPTYAIDAWVKGVQIHELMHCLDTRRDYAGPGGAWTGTASIAPRDRAAVHDGPSHYQSGSMQAATKLWREALADMGAVGYWRLHTSSSTGATLARTLRAKRLADSPHDTTHATMCWIDRALAVPPPAADQDLFAWTDALRTTAPCAIANH